MSSFEAVDIEGIYRDHLLNENEINGLNEDKNIKKL